MISKALFNRVIYKGIMGAIFGIVAGLILGVLIFGLTATTEYVYNYVFTRSSYSSYPPAGIFAMLGMGCGAIIGSVFGSITAFRENK
ncbi:MAG TPA: hypothetical protein P5229_02930 [Candidatus Gracilibacteria bacterium]|nr:hypothetical protein [Candidatus Gracilibacteria bacterium]